MSSASIFRWGILFSVLVRWCFGVLVGRTKTPKHSNTTYAHSKRGVLLAHRYRTFIFTGAFLIGLAGGLGAQDSLAVRDLRLFVQNDSLKCGFACPDLFSGSIEQTLLSGLPVLIEWQSRLSSQENPTVSLSSHKYRLTYDIWEERFTLENSGRRQFFASLKALQSWWNPREGLALVPLAALKNTPVLRLELSLSVILLTRAQGEKMKNWIFNTSETEENIPSMERDTGFRLNLNQVVSLFLGKPESGRRFEGRGASGEFTVKALPREGGGERQE